jgi:hypothetical protein
MRAIIQFIVDCLEALAEDETAARRRERERQAAQKRWHNYLAG